MEWYDGDGPIELVENGALLLDEHFGGREWVNRINLDTLDIAMADRCVLGQLYGSFWEGLPKLGLIFAQAPTYGFDIPSGTVQGGIALTKEWKRFLAARQR